MRYQVAIGFLSFMLAAGALPTLAIPKRAEKRGPTRIAGVDWEPSLAAAEARARKEHKPILQLHLFGRLDEEFC